MKTEIIKPNKYMLLPSELKMKIDRILQKGGLYMTQKKEMIEELMQLYYSNDSLNKAKEELRETFIGEECTCPLCKQNVKMYRRKLNSGMAAFLLGMYKLSGGNTECNVHYKDVMDLIKFNPNDYANLVHWGLIAAYEGVKTGYYNITNKGLMFLKGELNVPEKIFIYNSKLWGFSPEETTFEICLGERRFELQELMQDYSFFAGEKNKVL